MRKSNINWVATYLLIFLGTNLWTMPTKRVRMWKVPVQLRKKNCSKVWISFYLNTHWEIKNVLDRRPKQRLLSIPRSSIHKKKKIPKLPLKLKSHFPSLINCSKILNKILKIQKFLKNQLPNQIVGNLKWKNWYSNRFVLKVPRKNLPFPSFWQECFSSTEALIPVNKKSKSTTLN